MNMKKIYFIVIISLFISLTLSAEYDNQECDNIYCTEYEWYNNGGRFDPHTIEWPLHYTGETYKDYIDGGHHNMYINHGGHNSVNGHYSTLDHYRQMPECPSPHYMREGIEMHDPFECSYHVDDKPKWKDSKCSNVLSGYKDQVVYVDGPACSKVLRHWTIIDWCKWKPNTITNTYNEKYDLVYDTYKNKAYFAYGRGYHDVEHDGYYTFTQVIKIIDNHEPELVSCEDVSYNVPAGKCEAIVKLRNKIQDSGPCPGDKMTVELAVVDYDGVTVANKWLYANHDQSFDANLGYLDAGHYKVHWSISDGCGNKNNCIQKLVVEDNNPPDLLCVKDLSTSISDDYGVSIWARDFVHKLEGKCDVKEVTVSFQKNELEMSRHFNCDENLGIQQMTVYATDSKGNQASCNVELFVADHNACSDTEMQVAGAVFDRNRQALADVEIDVYQGETMVSSSTSNELGHYNLYGVPLEKSTIMMKPHMPDYSKDGLDQNDLLMLLRHITRVGKFSTVLEYAAADINSDARIDLEDYWDLAAMIYGLPGRDVSVISPWKFFDAIEYYGGQRKASKLVVPIPIRHFRHRYDIMGVKVGDIDFSIENNKSKSRNSGVKRTQYSVRNMGVISEYNISIPANTSGYGMTLRFENTEATSIKGISQGDQVLEYMSRMEGEDLLVSIISVNVLSDAPITIQSFRQSSLASEGSYIHDLSGDLSNDVLLLEEMGIEEASISISPNPFAYSFELNYNSTIEGAGTLQVLSIDGRTQIERNISLTKGSNQIIVRTESLNSGIYLLRLQVADQVEILKITKSTP